MTVDEIIKARIDEFKSADEETRRHMLNELEESLRSRNIDSNFDPDRICRALLWDKFTELSIDSIDEAVENLVRR